jgi:sec-independent protein translocase protein TatA
MGEFSIWHWLVVLLVVLLLFGGGKMSSLMGDFANGIKAFRKNMADDTPEAVEASAASISGQAAGEAAPRTPLRETKEAH